MSNPFGISDKSNKILLETFSKYQEIDEVIIFGSRAKGNYKKGSDIDIAIKGQKSSAKLAMDIKGILNEEAPIPYYVDVVDYNSLNQPELKEHIDRVGKVFYKKA